MSWGTGSRPETLAVPLRRAAVSVRFARPQPQAIVSIDCHVVRT